MTNANIPTAPLQTTSDFTSSRRGTVTQTSASVTSAELDTIEAELEARPTKPDRISNITSIFSALLVIVKVLCEASWHSSIWNIAFLVVGSGLAFIQIYRYVDSFKEKPSSHKKNVDRYLKKRRDIVGQ